MYMCVCVYMYMCVCVHVCVITCIDMYMCVCMYVCVCVCYHMYRYVCVCMCVCVCTSGPSGGPPPPPWGSAICVDACWIKFSFGSFVSIVSFVFAKKSARV
jgi:hypothetical protein